MPEPRDPHWLGELTKPADIANQPEWGGLGWTPDADDPSGQDLQPPNLPEPAALPRPRTEAMDGKPQTRAHNLRLGTATPSTTPPPS
jgi:hypothetical protein